MIRYFNLRELLNKRRPRRIKVKRITFIDHETQEEITRYRAKAAGQEVGGSTARRAALNLISHLVKKSRQ